MHILYHVLYIYIYLYIIYTDVYTSLTNALGPMPQSAACATGVQGPLASEESCPLSVRLRVYGFRVSVFSV